MPALYNPAKFIGFVMHKLAMEISSWFPDHAGSGFLPLWVLSLPDLFGGSYTHVVPLSIIGRG
jgi:hypothetical protein